MSYTPVPNEVYHIGLSAGAIAVYGYLLHIENRQTFRCYASYKTIGEAVKMSANTVRKYVEELETRHLIRTEQTSVVTKDGRKRNGTLLYNIRPIREAVDSYNERLLLKIEADAKRQRIQEQLSRRCTPQEAHAIAEWVQPHAQSANGCDAQL